MLCASYRLILARLGYSFNYLGYGHAPAGSLAFSAIRIKLIFRAKSTDTAVINTIGPDAALAKLLLGFADDVKKEFPVFFSNGLREKIEKFRADLITTSS